MALLFALIRQPLFHFLLIGAAVFGLFVAMDDSPTAPSHQEIEDAFDRFSKFSG
jgi:hypothetical protein